jgi:hypothetical protein
MTPSSGSRRYIDHPFWQAMGILVLAFVFIEFVIPALPGSSIVPKSVALQYMLTVLAGVQIYESNNEDRWVEFKEPINALMVEPRLRMLRGGVLGAVTLSSDGSPWHRPTRACPLRPTCAQFTRRPRMTSPSGARRSHSRDQQPVAGAGGFARRTPRRERIYYRTASPATATT